MPRIVALEPPFEPEVDEQLRRMMPPGVAPIALFRTFARNLPMTEAMHGWGSYELGRRLSVPLRAREIVIDRTCGRCGCDYEWGVHVAFFAERAGLSETQVRSLASGEAGDGCWQDEADRLLVELVDQLHDTSDVDDALWERLAASYRHEQLLDLLLLCGWYHAISYVANAARVTPEPFAPRLSSA